MRLITKKSALLLAVMLCFLGPVSGKATTVNLNFFGEQNNPNNSAFLQTLSGSLSFSYSTSSSPLTIGDLSSFSAIANYDTGHGPGSGTWNFSLGDLLTFSYDPSVPRQIDLTTQPVMSTNEGNGYATTLVISGLSVTVSTASATITPEPSSAGLLTMVAGAGALFGLRRRRRMTA